jgi:hypothetical protein
VVDAFTHIYEEWLAENPWIQSFTELATAENFEIEDDPEDV